MGENDNEAADKSTENDSNFDLTKYDKIVTETVKINASKSKVKTGVDNN